jgi:hypothetical protein
MNLEEYKPLARLFALRGEQCAAAKLTEREVAQIKEMHAKKMRLVARINKRYSVDALAKRYGVHRTTVEKIIYRETWAHVRSDL